MKQVIGMSGNKLIKSQNTISFVPKRKLQIRLLFF